MDNEFSWGTILADLLYLSALSYNFILYYRYESNAGQTGSCTPGQHYITGDGKFISNFAYTDSVNFSILSFM